ncbi:MAG: thioesterase family protein [Ketobacteraceae bacterium]|nr:thioesterase family protein [Ketobacteraceae bacterium]
MSKPTPPAASDYRYFLPITTRWKDNDIYGHVNNVTYYAYFDTVANQYLIEAGGLDIHKDTVVGFVVNSGCNYYAPVAFPDRLRAGLRVNRLGNSSVEYGIAIFKGEGDTAVADGHFVHVFVDKASNKAVAIPDAIKAALQKIATDRTADTTHSSSCQS